MDEIIQAQPRTPSAEELQEALREILPAKRKQHTTLDNVRSALEQHFQLSPGTLEPKKNAIDLWLDSSSSCLGKALSNTGLQTWDKHAFTHEAHAEHAINMHLTHI